MHFIKPNFLELQMTPAMSAFIICDATCGNIKMVLPAKTACGKEFIFKRADTTENRFIISASIFNNQQETIVGMHKHCMSLNEIELLPGEVVQIISGGDLKWYITYIFKVKQHAEHVCHNVYQKQNCFIRFLKFIFGR